MKKHTLAACLSRTSFTISRGYTLAPLKVPGTFHALDHPIPLIGQHETEHLVVQGTELHREIFVDTARRVQGRARRTRALVPAGRCQNVLGRRGFNGTVSAVYEEIVSRTSSFSNSFRADCPHPAEHAARSCPDSRVRATREHAFSRAQGLDRRARVCLSYGPKAKPARFKSFDFASKCRAAHQLAPAHRSRFRKTACKGRLVVDLIVH